MKKPSFKRMRAFLLWAVLAVYLVFCVVVPFLPQRVNQPSVPFCRTVSGAPEQILCIDQSDEALLCAGLFCGSSPHFFPYFPGFVACAKLCLRFLRGYSIMDERDKIISLIRVAGLYREAKRVFYHAEMLVLCDRAP